MNRESFHHSFQGVTASRLEHSYALLGVQHYNRLPFLNVCERSVSVFNRFCECFRLFCNFFMARKVQKRSRSFGHRWAIMNVHERSGTFNRLKRYYCARLIVWNVCKITFMVRPRFGHLKNSLNFGLLKTGVYYTAVFNDIKRHLTLNYQH